MKICFGFLAAVVVGLSSVAMADPTPASVLENQEGVSELKAGNTGAAQEKFLSGLSSSPLEAKLHYNLGLSFELSGQTEKAKASYETALKLAQDDASKFAANFNLGEMAQKAKKKDEALAYYQEALKYNPTSRETKINIELLTQDGQGQGQGEDQKDQKDSQEGKDGQGQGESKDQNKDDKNDDKSKDEKQKENQPKQYAKNKPQPRKFKSEELTQGDVNKILGEIKQQEQKIRSEFNKKEVKEQPRDKDW